MVAPHLRVTFSGIFGSLSAPQEIWQFALHYRDTVTTSVTSAAADACMQAFKDSYAGALRQFVGITQVKLSHINAAGHLASEPVISTAPGQMMGGAGAFPFQIAAAVTLCSNKFGKGPLTHGRFYLPGPGGGISLDDRWDSSAVVAGTKTFINSVSASLAGSIQPRPGPILVSRASPDFADVDRVLVGDVLDTIRTRRNKLKESYTLSWP